MTAKILTQNGHGKVLLICLIFSFNEIDEIKTFDFFLSGLGFTFTKCCNLSKRGFFV